MKVEIAFAVLGWGTLACLASPISAGEIPSDVLTFAFLAPAIPSHPGHATKWTNLDRQHTLATGAESGSFCAPVSGLLFVGWSSKVPAGTLGDSSCHDNVSSTTSALGGEGRVLAPVALTAALSMFLLPLLPLAGLVRNRRCSSLMRPGSATSECSRVAWTGTDASHFAAQHGNGGPAARADLPDCAG